MVGYPTPSSSTGSTQRPQVAHQPWKLLDIVKQLLLDNSGSYKFVNWSKFATSRYDIVRKTSIELIRRRRARRYGSSRRPRHRVISTHCSGADNEIVGVLSIEGTGGERNAGSSKGLPRRYGSTDRAYNSRKTSSLVSARQKKRPGERNGSPLPTTVHCRRGICGNQKHCAPSSLERPCGHVKF